MDWRARFAEYVTRKTAAAEAADVAGFETKLDRSAERVLEAVGNPWTVERFDGPFFHSPPPPAGIALSLIFVQSRDGNTETSRPEELGGGATDLHLVYEGLSRVTADAVLAGAQTVCIGGEPFSVWHPAVVALRRTLGQTRHPAQIVASLLGALPLERVLLFNVPELPVFILTTSDGARRLAAAVSVRPWITVLDGGPHSDLARQLRVLSERFGMSRISCVGGRHLATALLDAGVVRDLYLTTGARFGGTPSTPYYDGSRPPGLELVVRKHGRHAEAAVVFEHFTTSRLLRPSGLG